MPRLHREQGSRQRERDRGQKVALRARRRCQRKEGRLQTQSYLFSGTKRRWRGRRCALLIEHAAVLRSAAAALDSRCSNERTGQTDRFIITPIRAAQNESAVFSNGGSNDSTTMAARACAAFVDCSDFIKTGRYIFLGWRGCRSFCFSDGWLTKLNLTH